jgi:peptidoglycan/LPS O-acetylase OafA/YrhL
MKLREIERLRGVAILMVLAVHWRPLHDLMPKVARESWTGVDLFFVISGYVVSLSLLRLLPPLEEETTLGSALASARTALQTFYVRRFFRIVPAAFAVLLLGRLALAAFPQFGSAEHWLNEVIVFFGGVYNYALPYHDEYKFGQYWSLSVEEHFYLVLPMLFVTLRTNGRRLLACVVITLLCIAARTLTPPEGVDPYAFVKYSSHTRFDALMAGVALALVTRGGKPTPPIMPRWLMRWIILPGAIVLVACVPGAAPPYVAYRVGFVSAWALSALLVGFAALDQGYVLSFPGFGRAMEYIGTRSYALYLIHVPVERFIWAARLQWPEVDALLPKEDLYPGRMTLVFLALAIAAAEVLHQVVEKPFMRVGRMVLDPEQRKDLGKSRRLRIALAAVGVAVTLLYFRHGVVALVGPRNLALHATVSASSHQDGSPLSDVLTDGELESELGMSTQREQSPWATIDLGVAMPVGAIRVYNRADCCWDYVLPLELSVSKDGVDYHLVATRRVNFTQAQPWRIRLNGAPVRYVRLSVPQKVTTLCLSEVEVYESRAMAVLP